MADDTRPGPAFSRESRVLRLPERVALDDLSPDWAWGGATGLGTACAGIIHSLAPEARITSVKVLGVLRAPTTSARASAALRGIG